MPLDLKDILFTARAANFVLEITGALCFLDGIYFQYIEGESWAIGALYKRIEQDIRHQDVKLLVYEPIAQREYPNWTMALLTWNEETQAVFRIFNPDKALDLHAIDPKTAHALLRAWSSTSNWMALPAPPEGNA